MFLLHINQQDPSEKTVARCQQAIKEQKLIDVTEEPISRGDHTIEITNIQYDVEEVDACLDGTITRLYQDDNNRLYLQNNQDLHVVYPIKHQQDTNVSVFKFQPQGGNSMTQTESVAGTTFKEHKHYSQFFSRSEVVENGVTKVTCDAVLIPEPDNIYDPNAVMVVAKMKDGKPHHIGYLKSAQKGGKLISLIKQPKAAVLHILAYSENGDYNDTYTVTVDTEETEGQ